MSTFVGSQLRLGLATAAPARPVRNATGVLVGRFAVPPGGRRLRHIDALVATLQDCGVWHKLDALYVLAAHDAQAACRNWVRDSYNLVAVSGPSFTADRGYQGDGISSYLDTGFNPNTAPDALHVQNSAHVGLWSLTGEAGSGVDMGNSNTLLLARQAGSNAFAFRVNLGSSSSSTQVSQGIGHFVVNRTGASFMTGYNDGLAVGPNNGLASIAPDNSAIRLLGRNGVVSYSTRRIAAAHIGTGLTTQNISDIFEALRAYLQRVGAVA